MFTLGWHQWLKIELLNTYFLQEEHNFKIYTRKILVPKNTKVVAFGSPVDKTGNHIGKSGSRKSFHKHSTK